MSDELSEEGFKKREEFFKILRLGGLQTGEKIAKLAKEMHPDCLLTVPLYRSCVVVLRQKQEELERGKVSMILYHDPGWKKEELTKGSLEHCKEVLELWGQKNGPDITRDSRILMEEDQIDALSFLRWYYR